MRVVPRARTALPGTQAAQGLRRASNHLFRPVARPTRGGGLHASRHDSSRIQHEESQCPRKSAPRRVLRSLTWPVRMLTPPRLRSTRSFPNSPMRCSRDPSSGRAGVPVPPIRGCSSVFACLPTSSPDGKQPGRGGKPAWQSDSQKRRYRKPSEARSAA